MRLFVAVYPAPEALDDIVGQLARMRIGAATAAGVNVRLAARETLHLTLAFLGEVDDDRLPEVEAALGRAAATWRRPARRRREAEPIVQAGPVSAVPGTDQASPARPLRLRLGGGGRFGQDRFTILWAGIQGDVDALRVLGDATRRELRRARLPYDRRPYQPHLTLARPGERLTLEAVDADRAALDSYLGPPWSVTEMVLMRSHLGPRPRYDRLAAWPV